MAADLGTDLEGPDNDVGDKPKRESTGVAVGVPSPPLLVSTPSLPSAFTRTLLKAVASHVLDVQIPRRATTASMP